MSELKTKLPTDTWVVATWEEFIAMADDPTYNKAKCYYRNGQMRIETMSVGPDCASDRAIALLAIIKQPKIAPMRPGLKNSLPQLHH
jgi:hypothetical protein